MGLGGGCKKRSEMLEMAEKKNDFCRRLNAPAEFVKQKNIL